jgi:integrase
MPKRTRNPNGLGTYYKKKDGRIEWRQKIDGQPRWLSAKNMKELKPKVEKIRGLPVTHSKIKVSEWFDKWLQAYIEPLKKPATYEQYSTLYKTHINPIIGKRIMRNIESYDIQNVIAKANSKGLSTNTMRLIKIIMNLAFGRAKKDGIISASPVVDIEIPKKQAKIKKTLSVDELSKLFKAMENSRWIWSAKFMLVTGMRRGELLALKWSDIDWANSKIIIEKSNSQTGPGETKDAAVHYVPLSGKAIDYLEKQKQMLENEFNPILYREELKKKELIFPNKNGVMLQPHSYYTMMSRFAKKAGIKASPHCLRHTFVYFMRHKLSLKELQLILGHSESTTTLDIYGNMLDETLRKNADDIDKAFEHMDEEIKKLKNNKAGKVIPFRKRAR